jgi:hypothetical protein
MEQNDRPKLKPLEQGIVFNVWYACFSKIRRNFQLNFFTIGYGSLMKKTRGPNLTAFPTTHQPSYLCQISRKSWELFSQLHGTST